RKPRALAPPAKTKGAAVVGAAMAAIAPEPQARASRPWPLPHAPHVLHACRARCIDRASASLSSTPPPIGRSMPHHTSLIAILCVGFVLAFVLGMVAQRLRLSPLVGYLVAGIIAGPFTPGFVGDQ